MEKKLQGNWASKSLIFFFAEFSVSGNVTGHFHSKTVLVKEKLRRIFNKV
jgi:hypothetical protein